MNTAGSRPRRNRTYYPVLGYPLVELGSLESRQAAEERIIKRVLAAIEKAGGLDGCYDVITFPSSNSGDSSGRIAIYDEPRRCASTEIERQAFTWDADTRF